MKIPGLDTLVFQATRCLHRLGRIQLSRDLDQYKLRSPRGILIAVTTALGDSISFTPALSALRERFPQTRLVGFFHSDFAALYASDPRLDRVVSYHGKYKNVRRSIRELRASGCELALLPYINDPDIIPLLLLGGCRTLFRMPGRNTIYSDFVARPDLLSSTPPPDHAHVRATNMATYLGCEIKNHTSSLYPPPDAPGWVDELLNRRQLPEARPLIGFHPGASVETKCWPVDSYATLARNLLEMFPGAMIVLTGSKTEHGRCEAVRDRAGSPHLVNLAGEIPIQYMPELLRRLSVLVSGDTGIAHMAYASECRTVTMFWASRLDLSGPLEIGERNRVVEATSAWSIHPDVITRLAVEQIEFSLH